MEIVAIYDKVYQAEIIKKCQVYSGANVTIMSEVVKSGQLVTN